MADKQDKAQAYYHLHTDAVDELVGATAENTPRYTKEELERYTSGKKRLRMKTPVKVFLIKAWFYGAVCFFIFWGLGLYVSAQLDLFVAAALVMGMVTDLLINSLLRFGEKRPGQSARHMMVTRTGVLGLLLNLLYGGALMFLVVTIYTMINVALRALFGADAPFLGVEPFLFGAFATACDTLLIAAKRTLQTIASDAKRR